MYKRQLYVNITTHRSEYVYRELGGGLYERNCYRRRPGTVAVAAAIPVSYTHLVTYCSFQTDVFRTVAPVRVNIVCSEHEACEGTD